MKTIIIGLGNPILSDDGVGWKVAEEVKKQLTSPEAPLLREEGSQVDVEFLSLGGISLMENLIGYDRAILIDAVTSKEEVGSVTVSELTELPDVSAFHLTSVHDTSLQNAIKLGKAMGAVLPGQVTVVGIVTHPVHDFGEELSLPVSQAVPKAAQIVIELL
jgi:hydrogenase maturation protease